MAEDLTSEDLPFGFVGRRQEVELLKQSFIFGNAKAVSLIGGVGTGKTSLARVFSSVYEESYVGEAFYLYANSFGRLSDRVLNEVPNHSHPMLLVIDEFHLIPEADVEVEFECIFAARPTARILAVSQRDIHSSQIDLTIRLSNLNRGEMAELISKRYGHELNSSDIGELYEMLQGNPLAARMSGDALRDNIFSLNGLVESTKPFAITSLLGPDGKPLERESDQYQIIITDVTTVSDDLLKNLLENPKLLYDLSPRLFEEVVAESFRRQGYEVTLTPAIKDGGKDIYVASKNLLGSFLYIVECKKYSPDNPVGVGLIRQLYGVVQAEKATAGILATTSFFTKGAMEFQQQVAFHISLQDYWGIQKWLRAIHQKI
jgi:restriction system protein